MILIKRITVGIKKPFRNEHLVNIRTIIKQ